MIKQKSKPTLDDLIFEVKTLRSAVIGIIGHDPEGKYRPEFVKKILKEASEPREGEFVSAPDFLEKLEKHK